MSCLRVSTLRLCWLEAFLAVAEEENISAAARELNLNQSTVTRYLQQLENWLGVKLIKPGEIHDPQNPAISIRLTEEALKFHAVASVAVKTLSGARSDAARRTELMEDISDLICKMEAVLAKKHTARIASVKGNVEFMREYYSHFTDDLPIGFLEVYYRRMRFFFSDFEKFSRQKIRTTSAAEFDEAFFKKLAEDAKLKNVTR